MTKPLLYLICLAFLYGCYWGETRSVTKAVNKVYGIDPFGVDVKRKNLIVSFTIDKCLFRDYKLNQMKAILVLYNIVEEDFFDKVDTLFLVTYREKHLDTNFHMFFTRNSNVRNNLNKDKKAYKAFEYINRHMACEWFINANFYLSFLNHTYRNYDVVPKYDHIIDLITAAARNDTSILKERNIMTLEYYNEEIKKRTGEWPQFGGHIDSILKIINQK